MISRIQIKGLGPHRDLDMEVEPLGLTTITGPSEAGKTVAALDAVTFALWGERRDGGAFPVEAIHSDFDRADVQITLANGTELHRSMTGGRSIKRHKNGDRVATENDWRNALGALGSDPELLRAILVPGYWRSLLGSPGNGRRFRDLLNRVIPDPVDLRTVIAELMTQADAAFTDKDPHDEPTAVERRKLANRRRDENHGRLSHAGDLLAAAQAERFDIPSPGDADSVISSSEVWTAYHDLIDRWTETVERNAKDAELRAAWLNRRTALGDRPDEDQDAAATVAAAREARQAAVEDHAQLLTKRTEAAQIEAQLAEEVANIPPDPVLIGHIQALNDAEHDVGEARNAQAAAPDDDTCPTCSRDGWPQAAERREKLAEAVRVAEAAHEAAEADVVAEQPKADRRHKAAAKKATAAHAEARKALDSLDVQVKDAADRQTAAQAHLEEALTLGGDGLRWDSAIRALGPEPAEPVDPTKPKPPTLEAPSHSAVAEARIRLDEIAAMTAKAEQRADDIARGETQIAQLEEAQTHLDAEAERLDALVDAVRRAPSTVAERNLARLGDLGPVGISMQGQGVEITFDARPWWLASTGRRIVCGLHLRAALRRAANLPWLPIVVDDAQAWSGEWPDTPGPIWFLRTAPGDGIEVGS